MKEQKKYLKKNLKLLQNINPPLAYQLTMIDPEDLEFYCTPRNELNLRRFENGRQYDYHSPSSPVKEAQEWFESLDLHRATVIFLYGTGLGYYYEAAKPWLKQHPRHALVFLEEDPGVLHRLFETELGSLILKDPQVELVYFQDRETSKPLFNELSWTYFDSSFIVSSLKLYQEVNPEGFLQLHHQLSHDIVQKKAFVDEYLQYGIPFFRNFYPNLLEFPTVFLGNNLFNRFSQIPAIICGAGPSLNKNIDLLPALKERALLFAGGSALNALIPKGIIPHFGVAIDPNKAQYSRVAVTQPYSVPFFYRNRLFHEALKAIKGPRLYLTGSGGYEIARWFEEQLHIEGEDLDEGHNVVNFCLEIAQALGCNPIIFVGVDLAFTNQQHYADGIITNLNLTEEDFKTEGDFESTPLLKKDIDGQPVMTLWKWITEADWISKFAHKYSETMILNATEGGLGFEDIPNLTLEAAAAKYLTSPKEKIKHINSEIQGHSLAHLSQERIVELLKGLQDSLATCIALFSRLLEESDLLAKQVKQGFDFPLDLQTATISLLESDIETESSYKYLLDVFNQVYIRMRLREIQQLQSPKRKQSEKRRALKKLELQKQRITF